MESVEKGVMGGGGEREGGVGIFPQNDVWTSSAEIP